MGIGRVVKMLKKCVVSDKGMMKNKGRLSVFSITT